MANTPDWQIPTQLRPDPSAWGFDVDRALRAVLGLTSTIPEDAFTAGILGTERAGSGVLIGGDGLVVTIGYLVTEAETIWLTANDGQVAPGHVLGHDPESGLGLVQALRRLDLPALELGSAGVLQTGDAVIIGAAGGAPHALQTRLIGRSEFAGYWEYLIEGALFTAPAHPMWGGAALLGADGRLVGIGSLHVQHARGNEAQDANMVVPIDLLPAVRDEILSYGRPRKPPRPWLGLYAAEVGDAIVVAGLAPRGPAEQAGVQLGDQIVAVSALAVPRLAQLWRSVWAVGAAGAEIEMQLRRDGEPVSVRIRSADRGSFLKGPKLH